MLHATTVGLVKGGRYPDGSGIQSQTLRPFDSKISSPTFGTLIDWLSRLHGADHFQPHSLLELGR